jgi:hypothetical protein
MFEEKLPTELTVDDLHEAMAATVRRRRCSSSEFWIENHETLEKLWAEGWSAGVIAKFLGTTRNAVIGRVHRTKLPPRLTHHCTIPRAPVGQRKVAHPKPKLVWTRPITEEVRTVPAKSEPTPFDPYTVMPLMATTSRVQCRYIVDGEKATSLVCGAPTENGTSWCAHHLKLVSGQPRANESITGGAYAARILTGLSSR